MAIVIADLFTEAADTNLENHTPNTGTGWTLVAGAAGAGVVNSAADTLRPSTATASHYVSNPEPSSADTYAIFRSKSLSNTSPANAYTCIRLVNNTNFVGWRIAGSGAAGRRLSKNVAGTVTDLITSQGVANEWIKVNASGNIIQLWQGGTGATPTWVQVGANQTVTDHNTETSIGFQIGVISTIDWIDEYEGGTVDAGGVITATSAIGSSPQSTSVSVKIGVTSSVVESSTQSVTASTKIGVTSTASEATAWLSNAISKIALVAVLSSVGVSCATVAGPLTAGVVEATSASESSGGSSTQAGKIGAGGALSGLGASSTTAYIKIGEAVATSSAQSDGSASAAKIGITSASTSATAQSATASAKIGTGSSATESSVQSSNPVTEILVSATPGYIISANARAFVVSTTQRNYVISATPRNWKI